MTTYHTSQTVDAALVAFLKAQFPAYPVVRAFQHGMNGAVDGPAIEYFDVHYQQVGAPLRQDVLNSDGAAFTHTEIQRMSVTVQIQVSFGDSVPDLLLDVSMALQSDVAASYFQAIDIARERVTDILTPRKSGDQDLFTITPNFSIVLTFNKTQTTTVPVITTVTFNAGRV